MKKTICLLLILCFLCTTAFAAPIIDNNNELRTIDISGVSDVVNGKITLTIVKKADGILPSDLASSILFYELLCDENGNYSGQFTLPATAERGVYYSVYVSGDETAGEFYYATDEEISSCISDFQNATEDNIKSLLESYTSPENVLGVSLGGDRENHALWADKAIVEFLGENNPENITDIIDSFNKSIEAALIMSGDSKEIEKALNANLLENVIPEDISIKDLSQMFESVRGSVKEDSVENIADFIKTTLREATAIVKINSATKGIMTEVLKEYNDVLELELDGKYKSNEVKVNKALTDKNFKTLSEVRKAFEKALTEKKPTQSSGGGSTGGGGISGGGASSNVIEFSPTVNEPKKEETEKITFSDIQNVTWAQEAIENLCNKGIIAGYEDNTFKPGKEVTRAEFTKMIAVATGLEDGNTTVEFDDVSENDWFAPFVKNAASAGIIKGNGTKFLPNGFISREDAAVIIYRVLSGKLTSSSKFAFADNESISDYAKDAVGYLASDKIISGMGDGTFAPKSTLTRAQAAVLINSVVNKLQ